MGNVAGSFAVLCYGYITWCTGYHLYEMDYIWSNHYYNYSFFAGFISVVICEWIFMTLIMALCFFQANFFGCTCCCKDPTEGGAIGKDLKIVFTTVLSEPVNVMAAPQAQYPMAVPYQGQMMPVPMQQVPMQQVPMQQVQMQPVQMQQMAPVYGQPAPYGMYAPNQATKKDDSDSSSSDSSDSDSD
jgi:hypothetical protein